MVIKDFISLLKNIRNKIANRWTEMRQPPSMIQKAFRLANDMKKQLQVVDSFKLEFSNFPSVEVNEISVEESSGDEFEVNEMSKGKGAIIIIIIIIIIVTNALILAIVTILATGPNTTNLKTADKVNLRDRKVRTPKSH